MKSILFALLVTIMLGITKEECLSVGMLNSLGLKANSAPEAYSSGDVCSTYFKETGAKSCVDADGLDDVVALKGGQWKKNYEAEHYEIYANLDSSFNEFVNGYVEIAQKGTFNGKKVNETTKANFNSAYSWVEKYGVGDKNVSNEVEACTQAQLNNTFGSYCMLSSDKASTFTGDCPEVQSKTESSGSNTTSDSADQDSVDAYNQKLDESKTSRRRLASNNLRVNIDEESTTKLVDACADTIRALCLNYKIQTALSSGKGQSFPQELKNRCSEDFLVCASKVKDKNGVVPTETTCNHKQRSLMVKEFFGGVGNRIIPSATRNANQIKYSTELARQNLYAKLANHGFGEVKKETTTQAETGSESNFFVYFFLILQDNYRQLSL